MRDKFEAAIRDDIDALEPYLVYSDWLTEQEDPRGEFIRLQIQLEDASIAEQTRKDAQDRIKSLLKEHDERWSDGITASVPNESPGLTKDTASIEYRRGFPHTCRIRYLSDDMADRIGPSTAWSYVRALDISYMDSEWSMDDVAPGDSPSALFRLMQSADLSQLKSFSLGDVDFDQDYYHCETQGLGVLDLIEKFPQIEVLQVAASGLDASQLFAIPMPSLRVLRLMHERDYPVRTLAENQTMTQLEELSILPHALEYGDLPYLNLDDLTAICQSPNLGNLKVLRLRLTMMGDDSARALVGSKLLEQLEVLDLKCGNMTDDGAAIIAASPKAKNLKAINLDRNALTEHGIALLKQAGIEVSAERQHNDNAEEHEWLYEGDIE